MKKRTLTVATAILAATMLTSSCIGKFALFNGLLSWNQKATGNKFLNELIFIVISPAYAVCTVADALVLNTVEFWSGSNPIGKAGKVEKVWGQDGRQYAVKTLKNGYEITDPKGKYSLSSMRKSRPGLWKRMVYARKSSSLMRMALFAPLCLQASR